MLLPVLQKSLYTLNDQSGDNMKKKSEESKEVRLLPRILISGVVVTFIWVSAMFSISCYFPELEERGQFGDMFGSVNALFAGLAFSGVIWAIIIQKQELELQRKEIRGQKEQLQAQDLTLQKQNFESSFFQLMSFHNEIVNSLETRTMNSGEKLNGRSCFRSFLYDLRHAYDSESHNDSEQDFNSLFELFLGRHQSKIGHYFRHLYNTVKFVDQHHFLYQSADRKTYTNLIRAQLSSNELGLLFYNCLSDRGTKFKFFVEKYSLLEDMDIKVLFEERHKSLYKESAYGNSA